MALLEATNLYAGYGGMNIFNGVDAVIDADEIGVIIGANGAGKSTLLKAIFGLLNVTEGTITLAGKNITNMNPDKLVRAGMALLTPARSEEPFFSIASASQQTGH